MQLHPLLPNKSNAVQSFSGEITTTLPPTHGSSVNEQTYEAAWMNNRASQRAILFLPNCSLLDNKTAVIPRFAAMYFCLHHVQSSHQAKFKNSSSTKTRRVETSNRDQSILEITVN